MTAADESAVAATPFAQAAQTGIGSIVLQALGFASTMLLARGLGPPELGKFQFVVSVAVLVTLIGTLGLDEALAYLVPRYEIAQPRKLRALTNYVLLLTIAIGILAGAVFFAAATALEQLLRIPGLSYHLRFLLVLCPVLMALSISLAALRGLGRSVWRGYIYYYTVSGLFLIGVIVGWWCGLTPLSAYAARIGSIGIGALIAAYLVRRTTVPGGSRLNIADIRAAHSLAGWVLFVGIFQYAVEQPLIDLAIVGRYDAPAMLGFYSVAAKIAAVIATGSLALNYVMAPVFARAIARGDMRQLRAGYRKSSWWMAASVVVLGAAVLVLHRPVLLLFGREYGQATQILRVFAAGQIAVGLAGLNTPLIIAAGFARIEFYLSGGASLFLIIAGILLGQGYGAIGVASASAAAITLLALGRRIAAGQVLASLEKQLGKSGQ